MDQGPSLRAHLHLALVRRAQCLGHESIALGTLEHE